MSRWIPRLDGWRRRLAIVVAVVFSSMGHSMAFIYRADQPMPAHVFELLSRGADGLFGLPGYLGCMEGQPISGGMFMPEYTCPNAATFNRALLRLAAVETSTPRVVVHDGTETSYIHHESKLNIQWRATIWSPERWYQVRSGLLAGLGMPPDELREIPPPTIDVWPDGAFKWEDVKIPANVTLIDKRASAAPVQPVKQGVFAGTITNMANGWTLADAEVTLWRSRQNQPLERVASTTTDASGRYLIENVSPPGSYRLYAACPKMATRVVTYYLKLPVQYQEINVGLCKECTVKGTFTSMAGKAIGDAMLQARYIIGLDGAEYELAAVADVKTDSGGQFIFTGLPAGQFTVYSMDRRYNVTPPFTQFRAPAYEPITIAARGTGAVAVCVLGMDPAKQYNLDMRETTPGEEHPWGYGGVIPDDGKLKIEGVPEGRYSLEARPNPYSIPKTGEPKADRFIDVVADKTLEVEITAR